MPRYDYYCPKCGGHFEARRGVECSSTPCPICGTEAERAFCSGLPAIHGETVGKSYDTSGAITKHGYMDLDLFQEAHADVLRDAKKAGVEPPDLWAEAKKRVASGEVTERRIAR